MDRFRSGARRFLMRLSGDQRGGVIIETAFVLPVFLILVLGTLGWSYFLLRQVVLQYAVEYSSRCRIIPPVNGVSAPFCGTYQSYGVANGLGLYSDQSVFSEPAEKSVSNSGYSYTLLCVRGQSDNPLGFLQGLALPLGGQSLRPMVPAAGRASFCRVDPLK